MDVMRAPRTTTPLSLHDVRTMVGARVAAQTVGGPVEGTLLSCTARSAWIVDGDVDHMVDWPSLLSIQPR